VDYTEARFLEVIARGAEPPLLLVGGDNEYLVERAFAAIRGALADGPPPRVLESFGSAADLALVLDAFRTGSLFGGRRLLVVTDVHAFVTRKELSSLLEKALADWKSAKTDRKRSSAMAKLLHVLGLAAIGLDEPDEAIASALGLGKAEGALLEMLALARGTGKKPTRGEDDAALLAEAAAQGGAPGAILLMRTGEIPKDSATVSAIARAGAVVRCDLSREQFGAAFGDALGELAAEAGVTFEPAAVAELRSRLGIERLLADKFGRDVPDLRVPLNEAERLATFVGRGGRVTREVVARQVEELGGGMRWELGSLFAEGKPIEAIAKLRELVAQSLREDPKANREIHFGRFLFAFADEIRQLLGIHSWARLQGIDLRKGMSYNRFKTAAADSLGAFLKDRGLVRQKPHPFALHKRFESAKLHREEALLEALDQLAELEFLRKCGGVPIEVGLETLVLGSSR
jgi:hypothetical protein